MESIYLKTLVETVATGSLSKAADNLCITPSAASRRIKFLEDQYGYPLLDRSGSPLVPTAAGKWVVDKALGMLEIENELLAGLKGMGQREGVVFCSTHAFGIAHLPKVLADFMLFNPDTSDLKFFFDQPDDIVKGLRENIYDLAVIEHCECFDFDEFATYPLPNDEVVFISSPHLGIGPVDTTIDMLFEHTLYSRNEGCCASKFLDMNLKSVGRNSNEFSHRIIVDDLHLIINSVVNGSGVAFISRGVVEKYLAAGTLVYHHIDGFLHARKRTLVTYENNCCNPAAKSLRNCILSYFNP